MDVSDAKFDVVIIGGGPAGMSAALWCVETGLTVALIEGERLGGQLNIIHNPIKNYIGSVAANGAEMSSKFISSLESLPMERVIGIPAESVDFGARIVTLIDGRSFEWRSLVIATGVRRRQLSIPGEAEFLGRGVMISGVGEKQTAIGKTVVIIGGGDAAVENALLLSEVAANVMVVHRRSFCSARQPFVGEAMLRPNIQFLFDTTVTAIEGAKQVTKVVVNDQVSNLKSIIATDLVLVRIGVVPNSELASHCIETDDRGYIVVDAKGETSTAGVFAVGDVANPRSPTISTATGTAATAVKSISDKSN